MNISSSIYHRLYYIWYINNYNNYTYIFDYNVQIKE